MDIFLFVLDWLIGNTDYGFNPALEPWIAQMCEALENPHD